jgi:hypothetical protein
VFRRFGLDKGADMPLATGWTRALQPLMNAYGNDPRYRLVVYTLDESSYSRELAPMAGHYPALTLGAPWWFFDSVKGMERYLDAVMETAGAYNLAGFNGRGGRPRAGASAGVRAGAPHLPAGGDGLASPVRHPPLPARSTKYEPRPWKAGLVLRGVRRVQRRPMRPLGIAPSSFCHIGP